ncbi:unnamed protein product [Protopolystoma xenopodis]|uniref:Uncharacterized protein n=1 Tax=Protopolystoma xenopodis TaxID=117903 RepID=A0A448XBW1_9PLAT|nr:unnamed protein product [Protopolystoma xenopodis]
MALKPTASTASFSHGPKLSVLSVVHQPSSLSFFVPSPVSHPSSSCLLSANSLALDLATTGSSNSARDSTSNPPAFCPSSDATFSSTLSLAVSGSPGDLGTTVGTFGSSRSLWHGEPGYLTTVGLPSLVLASDPGVYELLFNLAEMELQELAGWSGLHSPSIFQHRTNGNNSNNFDTRSDTLSTNSGDDQIVFGRVGRSSGDTTKPGFFTSPSPLSLLHSVRLLLACLPTYQPAPGSLGPPGGPSGLLGSVINAFSWDKNTSRTSAEALCSPDRLVAATPFRTLYYLQAN